MLFWFFVLSPEINLISKETRNTKEAKNIIVDKMAKKKKAKDKKQETGNKKQALISVFLL